MAATLKRASAIALPSKAQLRSYSLKLYRFPRTFHPEKKFEDPEDPLAAKGFLRSVKPYEPPGDVRDRLRKIFENAGVSGRKETVVSDPATRFSILRDCFREFSHAVPNSSLCAVETIGDIVDFYLTPVDTVTPYDALKRVDLPENVHVQYDYVRFHPDTDTAFGGISAFPRSSTLVTGLKYKKKYAGYEARPRWMR